MISFSHVPVMLEECMRGLALKDGGVYFDGTVGGGGHSFEILERTSPDGRLIATDLDDNAIAAAKARLSPFAGRFTIRKSNYKEYERVLEETGTDKLDGVLLDFGVSSFQLDEESRGFSYMKNAPLDMRMDPEASLTAETVVNEYPEQALCRIIREYGEEPFAKKIAANIAAERKKGRIRETGQLVSVIERSIPAKFRHGAPFSRKTFQAIRIEVNDELGGMEEAVRGLTLRLKGGGRICILTFHSLEDRIVKNVFRDLETDCICDKNFPVCVCGRKKEIEIITKKPLTASEEELRKNPRSKSAKLRIAERVETYN